MVVIVQTVSHKVRFASAKESLMATDTPNVAEEIQQEEVVQPENTQSTEQSAQEKPQTQSESDKEYNFKQLRERQRQTEEQLDFYKRQVEQLTPKTEEAETPSVGEDDLLEGRHYKMLQKEISRLGEEIKRKEMEAIPDRLKSRFSDFNDVVTKENVEKLKKSEPELYATITSTNDLFAKGVSAYKALMGLGYYKPKEDFSREKKQVEANANKPLSVQALKGQGALHEAHSFSEGLTPELKKKLQEEMAAAIKAH
jgi:hypothetical protein